MIELVHVQKAFEDVTPLRDICTTINKGDVISVIGPSGCGKSTLLRCINLLDPPTSGQIFMDGEEITAPGYDAARVGAKMGMVFQKFNLFPHWTAVENIMNPQLDILKCSRQEAYETAMRLLREVGLAEKAFAYPRQLSGGQQQRVAICRTLAMQPEIVLFDEPTSALDPTKVGEVEDVILALAQRGSTMMVVTHEMRFAKQVANRVFYLDEGGIYEEGSPEQIFDHPQHEKTRVFVKSLKSQTIEITSRNFDFLAATNSIDAYCAKCRISRELTRHAQTVFEELCVATLLPRMDAGDMRIQCVFEWSEAEESFGATVLYNGKAFNPEGADDLSWKFISGAASQIHYEQTYVDGFTNKVEIVFR